jgi:hypothetical protein
MARRPISDIVTVDDLAGQFGAEHIDSFDERVSMNSETYGYVYREALARGMTEEEAEEAARRAEDEEREEAVGRYADAITSVADRLYGEHGLELVPRNPRGGRAWEFKVVPRISWEDAANHIRETINGVGQFYFESLRDFLESGPWTARQAVLSHLHWIADWPRVYGSGTASSMVDRQLRY